MFTPHNFHDRDPSRKSAQGVTLELGKGTAKPKYFGGRYTEGVCLNVVSHDPRQHLWSGFVPDCALRDDLLINWVLIWIDRSAARSS